MTSWLLYMQVKINNEMAASRCALYPCLAAKHACTPSLFPCLIKVIAEQLMEPRKQQGRDRMRMTGSAISNIHTYTSTPIEGTHESINAALLL